VSRVYGARHRHDDLFSSYGNVREARPERLHT